MSIFGLQRAVESVRRTAGGTIAAMRLIRAPHEMRVVIETGASTETAVTHVMTDNTAAAIQRTPETVLVGNQWNTETGTGKGTVTERGTEKGKGTMLTGKMMYQYKKKEVTEEDMAGKRGGARTGWRAGMNHVEKGWEEEEDVHQTMLRKVGQNSCVC